MDLSTYRLIHYAGIMLLFLGYGGVLAGALLAGRAFAQKRLFTIVHGVGLLFILVSGFGQLARLGIVGAWPSWLVVKIVIWFAFGGLLTLVLRRPKKWYWVGLVALGMLAAYMGHFKP